MKRTTTSNKIEKEYERPVHLTYSINEEPLIFSKHLLDTLLKSKNFSEVFALYGFYYYTAKWQKTNQPKATTSFVAKGIGWGRDKVISVKKDLIKLGLIEDSIHKGPNGKISGYYIKVNFIWCANHTPENKVTGEITTPLKTPLVAKSDINSLSPNSINALSSNTSSSDSKDSNLFGELITPNMFPLFWALYPRKENKKRTSIIWDSLCHSKTERPAWNTIRRAVKAQIKTKQWQNPVFIKQPNKWLEDNDWERDISTMQGRTEQAKRINVTGSIQPGVHHKLSDRKV